MAGCNINITSVVVGPTYQWSPVECQTYLTISGTVSGTTGVACTAVTVKATCHNGTAFSGTIDSNGTVSGSAVSGTFTGNNWQLYLETGCCCNTGVIITASCPSLGCSDTHDVKIPPCPTDCCPKISTQIRYGTCDGSGNAVVTFDVTVTQAAGCPPCQVQLDFGDGSQPYSASGSFTQQHTYGPGPHTAYVNTISPMGCQQVEVPLIVPCSPWCCPKISAAYEVGQCNAAGMALVTFHVNVIPVTAEDCPPTQVQMDFGGGCPPLTFGGSFTTQCYYGPGSHTAFVNVISPKGCKQVQLPFTVNCPPCCPTVSITPCVQDCDSNGNRTVKFDVTVSPPPAPCPPVAAAFHMDFGDGYSGQSYSTTGTTPYSYTETHLYTGNAALTSNTAVLQITQPSQCVGGYAPQVIPACCVPKRASWCTTLMWIMSFAFAFALVFLLFTLLPSGMSCVTCGLFATAPGYTPLDSFYVFAFIGTLALILYLLYCTKCRCGWLYLLLWRVLSGAGLFLFIFAGCSFGIISVLIGLALILLAYLLLKQWQNLCCVPLCPFLGEILQWFIYMMAIAACLVAHVSGGCVYNLLTFTFTLGFPAHVYIVTITTYDIALAALAWYTAYYKSKC